MLRKIILSVLVMSIFSFGYSNSDEVVNLVGQRAKLMRDVGLCKYRLNKSVYDSAQEVGVLQNAVNIAKENNLDINSLLVFIQIQMDLSKQIETYYYKKDGESKVQDDCLSQLRIKIKAIDEKLYPQVAKDLRQIKATPMQKLKSRLIEDARKDDILVSIPSNPNYLGLVAQSLKNIKNSQTTRV